MVKVDWYLRTVLTIIAACLVWLCISSSPVTTSVEAQSGQQKVIVAGWSDSAGYVHRFPNREVDGNASAPFPLPVSDAR